MDEDEDGLKIPMERLGVTADDVETGQGTENMDDDCNCNPAERGVMHGQPSSSTITTWQKIFIDLSQGWYHFLKRDMLPVQFLVNTICFDRRQLDTNL